MFEISVMEKNYKQSDPEGRAAFINAVARRLLEFPQELERSIYIEAIASRYGIASDLLKKTVNSFGKTMSREQVEAAIRERQTEEVPVRKRQEKEDSILTAQKLLLTWLIEDSSLFEKIEGIISEADFSEPLYHRVASLVFDEYRRSGQVMPARILNQFEDVEEQKKAAPLFNTKLSSEDEPAIREKAFNETVRRIRGSSLERASRNVKDVAELQKIIQEKAKLQKLYISL